MRPAIAGLVGLAVALGYLPILRSQVRSGEVGVPIGGVNPLRIRREDAPFLFRFAVAIIIVLTGLIALGAIGAIVLDFAGTHR